MYITPPRSHHTWLMNVQEWLLMTVVCPACRLHEWIAERWEKEQQVIEILPASHFLKDQSIPERVTLVLHMSAYDIEKMRHIKLRMQRVKELITKYTTLSADRTACVQSPVLSAPYTISVDCLLNKEKTYREVRRNQKVTPLEEMYIRRYQVFHTLFSWWDKIMSTSLLGDWIPLLVEEKKNVYLKKLIQQKIIR